MREKTIWSPAATGPAPDAPSRSNSASTLLPPALTRLSAPACWQKNSSGKLPGNVGAWVGSGAGTAPPQYLSCGSSHGIRSTPLVSRSQPGKPLLALTGPTAIRPCGPALFSVRRPLGAAMATAPTARTRNVARATIFRVRPVGRRPTSRFIRTNPLVRWEGTEPNSAGRRLRANEQSAHARLRLWSYRYGTSDLPLDGPMPPFTVRRSGAFPPAAAGIARGAER